MKQSSCRKLDRAARMSDGVLFRALVKPDARSPPIVPCSKQFPALQFSFPMQCRPAHLDVHIVQLRAVDAPWHSYRECLGEGGSRGSNTRSLVDAFAPAEHKKGACARNIHDRGAMLGIVQRCHLETDE